MREREQRSTTFRALLKRPTSPWTVMAASRVAREAGLDEGWRLIANTREHGGQEVSHLHLHVVGGRKLGPMLSH